MSTRWTKSSIPDLGDKVAIVTGGNIGLGFQTSLELVRKGAHVTIACRSTEKGEAAISRIRDEVPDARLDTIPSRPCRPSVSTGFFGELLSKAHPARHPREQRWGRQSRRLYADAGWP